MGDRDDSHSGEPVVGRLYWFREPPLIGAVVEILDVHTDPVIRMQTTRFRVLACASRPDAAFTIGEVVTVGVAIAGGYPLWSLSRLSALNLDTAVREVEAAHLRRSVAWRR